MLKEQVAEIIYGRCGSDPGVCDTATKVDCWDCMADKILNLFKAEVDKLTVIPLEQALHTGGYKYACEAQLQHTKKQLLDLMRE